MEPIYTPALWLPGIINLEMGTLSKYGNLSQQHSLLLHIRVGKSRRLPVSLHPGGLNHETGVMFLEFVKDKGPLYEVVGAASP